MNDSADCTAFPDTVGTASLPMYTLPEITDTVDKWWRGVARHMRTAGACTTPDTLVQPTSVLEHWTDENLVFSQTCGFPLIYLLKNKVRMIATPIYDAPGCKGPDYRSMIIVPKSLNAGEFTDLRHLDAAVNTRDSQSGFNAFRALISGATENQPDEKFFARTIVTGSHEGSIDAVRTGAAQCACIDGVTLALFRRYRPSALKGIRVLCETDRAPGLPFITHGETTDQNLQALRDGLFSALRDPELVPLADAQLLKGATVLEADDYDRISQMAEQGAGVHL